MRAAFSMPPLSKALVDRHTGKQDITPMSGLNPKDTACVLLAAGRSARFGDACKLSAAFGGRRLGDHAAQLYANLPFAAHILVGRPGGFDAGAAFERIEVDDPHAGQSHSIVCGIRAILDRPVKAVFIALADMPFVTVAHIDALMARFDANGVVASSLAGQPMPPALIGRDHFKALMTLAGDAGARELLRLAPKIEGDPRMLADIDTQGSIHWEDARAR
jgi:molybdenum cofactor cytidylyltransferase